MQYLWLNKDIGNKKLILFFNGWAMNETPFQHLKKGDYDILMLFDYKNLDFNFSEFDFSKYDEKYLICWSMGVYCSSYFYDVTKDFDKKIAINGTLKLIDDDFGIPKRLYRLTTNTLSESSLDKFIKNMFCEKNYNPSVKITRKINELKEELLKIREIKLEKELVFDKAFVSMADKIVPTKNQLAFWEEKEIKVEKLNSTHCPFELFQSWWELIC